jgi:hypothetical protein
VIKPDLALMAAAKGTALGVPADRVLAVPATAAWHAIADQFGRNTRVALIVDKV